MALAGDDETAYARRVCDVQGLGHALPDLETGDGVFRLKDGALFRSPIVDEVAADDRDGAVGEPDRNLTQIIEHHECGRRELSSAILHRDRAETLGVARFLFRLVQRPHLQRGFRREVLRDGDQERRVGDVADVCDRAVVGVGGLEAAHDFQRLGEDAHRSVRRAQEQRLGSSREGYHIVLRHQIR